MGFHRSPDRRAAADAWNRFVERNAHVIAAAGLPPAVTASIDDWDAFLTHGSIANDPIAVDRLTSEQYASLVVLTESYFAAGYEFFIPTALHAEDQQRLHTRFLR
jgi:hypothetical protein